MTNLIEMSVFIEPSDYIQYGVLEEPFFKSGRVNGAEIGTDITFGNIYQVGDTFLKVATLDVVEEDDVVKFSESNALEYVAFENVIESNALEYVAFENVIESNLKDKNSQCMDKSYEEKCTEMYHRVVHNIIV